MLCAYANGRRPKRLQSPLAEIEPGSTMLFGLRGLLISVPECKDTFSFSAIGRRAFSDNICSQHCSDRATTCSAAAFTVRLAARLAPREPGTNRKFNRRTYEISLGDPC